MYLPDSFFNFFAFSTASKVVMNGLETKKKIVRHQSQILFWEEEHREIKH
jgi:hypothetical protein